MAKASLNLYRIKYLASGERERILEKTEVRQNLGDAYPYKLALFGKGVEIDVDIELDPRLYKTSCIIFSSENYKDTELDKSIQEEVGRLLDWQLGKVEYTWEHQLSELQKNKRSIENIFFHKGWIDDSEVPQSSEVKEGQNKKCFIKKLLNFLHIKPDLL